MSSSTTTALVEPSAMSNRRQPVRQARVNPPRNAAGARTLGGVAPLSAVSEPAKDAGPPGFFPGITHFTDSITALPREMIRHYTMLKEVDAKIYHPEEALKGLVAEVLKVEPKTLPVRPYANVAQVASFTDDSSSALVPAGDASQEPQYDMEQREKFLQLRMLLNAMLPTLDEKSHVMSTATDALDAQLARCASSWPAIEREISEETRWGNLNHWAYTSNSFPEKKPAANVERPRREAALTNGNAGPGASGDREPHSRGLDTRTFTSGRKHRINHNDSDFDEPKGTSRKPTTSKGRKGEPTSAPALSGLGITNGAAAPNKRRKIEKPSAAVGGQPMDRSMSSVYGQGGRGGAAAAAAAGAATAAGSTLETPAADSSKKKGRAANLNAGSTGRKRAGTVNSTAGSPSMASSPVIGTFTTVPRGGNNGNSPALGAPMQRSTSTRARQNSTQAAANRPAPTSHKEPNGSNGNHQNHTAAESHPVSSSRNAESKVTKLEDTHNAEASTRTSGRSADRSNLKREETSTSRHRPPSISTATRTTGKASKAATPVAASFPDPPRPRSGRNTSATAASLGFDLPVKRSHKKGGGIGAMAAAAAAAAKGVNAANNNTSASSTHHTGGSGSGPISGGNGSGGGAGAAAAAAGTQHDGDGSAQEVDDEDEDLEGEPRYCYCNSVSYGEMVACDYTGCKGEWFHLDCAGLTKAPQKNEKWYCKDCAPKVR